MAGNGWKWLELAGNSLKRLEWLKITENVGNVWKWLEMAGMAGNGWNWLDMAGNDWK